MMIRVPLKLEEKIVGESVRSIPTMMDINFFILSIFQFIPTKSIMFKIVDGF